MQAERRNSLSEMHKHNSWTTTIVKKKKSEVSPSLSHMRTSLLTGLQFLSSVFWSKVVDLSHSTRLMLLDLCVHIDQHRDHIFSYSQILFHLHYRIRPKSLLCHLIISSYLLPFCGGGESNFEKTFLFMPTGAD